MHSLPSTLPRRDAGTAPNTISESTRRMDSRTLLAGARELVIEHLGQHYHLRLTRNDKLILTK